MGSSIMHAGAGGSSYNRSSQKKQAKASIPGVGTALGTLGGTNGGSNVDPLGTQPPVSQQTRISCKDVSAETLYDVLHDTHYRKKWDSHMIETHDIGRLTVNADVGYYSCEQPPAPAHPGCPSCGPTLGCNQVSLQGSAPAP